MKTVQKQTGEKITIPYHPEGKPITIVIGDYSETDDSKGSSAVSPKETKIKLLTEEESTGVEVAHRAAKLMISDKKIILTNLKDKAIHYGTEVDKPTPLEPGNSVTITNNADETRNFWFSLGNALTLKSSKTEGKTKSLKTLLLEQKTPNL